ncbi:hypothetical protein M15_01390 [Atrimonas thermophila]
MRSIHEYEGSRPHPISQQPVSFSSKLRTTNSIERVNEEIRRREQVIRIFTNRESSLRLIGAFLMEYDEKWSGRRYLEMSDYYQRKTSGGQLNTAQENIAILSSL